ncbi:hypothetical protein CHS0354_032140 [Potamilus streckersoni]|uniref:Transmembrane protein n=1 Tax=Potamilus streckersoni TaxID=2493646 RepID=A0AAE0TGP9_9BIVA|nr:hypothetical protein CHS0354_032140 [Potamilus streckersoni]
MKTMVTSPKAEIRKIEELVAMEIKMELVRDKNWTIRFLTIYSVAFIVTLTTAITLIFFLCNNTSETSSMKTALVTFKDKTGKNLTEKVAISFDDTKNDISGYDRAIFDFEKRFLVYKVERMPKPVCFLASLRTSDIVALDNIMAFASANMEKQDSSKMKLLSDFNDTDIDVPRKDFLSELSKELCSDTDLVWMVLN